MKKSKHIGLLGISAFALILGVATSMSFRSTPKIDTELKNKILNNKELAINGAFSTNANTTIDLNANYNNTINTRVGYEGKILTDQAWYEMTLFGETDADTTTYSFLDRQRAIDLRKTNRDSKARSNRQSQMAPASVTGSEWTIDDYDGSSVKAPLYPDQNMIKLVNNQVVDDFTYVFDVSFVKLKTDDSFKIYAFANINSDIFGGKTALANAIKKDSEVAIASNNGSELHYLSDGIKPATAYEGEIMCGDIITAKGVDRFTLTSQTNGENVHYIYVTTPNGEERDLYSGTMNLEGEYGLYTILETDLSTGNAKQWFCVLSSTTITCNLEITSTKQTQEEIEQEERYFNSQVALNNEVYLWNGYKKEVGIYDGDDYEVYFPDTILDRQGQAKVSYFVDKQHYQREEPESIIHTERDNCRFKINDTGIYHIEYMNDAGTKLDKVIYATHTVSNLVPSSQYNEYSDKFTISFKKEMADYVYDFSTIMAYGVKQERRRNPEVTDKVITEISYEEAEAIYEQAEAKDRMTLDLSSETTTFNNYGIYFIFAMDKYHNIVQKAWNFNYAYSQVSKVTLDNCGEEKSTRYYEMTKRLGSVQEIKFTINPQVYQLNNQLKFISDNENIAKVVPETQKDGTVLYYLVVLSNGDTNIHLYATKEDKETILSDMINATLHIIVPNAEVNMEDPIIVTNYATNQGKEIIIPRYDIDNFYNYEDPIETVSTMNLNLGLEPKVNYSNVDEELKEKFPDLWATYIKPIYYNDEYFTYVLSGNFNELGEIIDGNLLRAKDYGTRNRDADNYFAIQFNNFRTITVSKNFSFTIDYRDVLENEKDCYDWNYNTSKGVLTGKKSIDGNCFFPEDVISIEDVNVKQSEEIIGEKYFCKDLAFEFVSGSQIAKNMREGGDKTKTLELNQTVGQATFNIIIDRENRYNRYKWVTDEQGEKHLKLIDEPELITKRVVLHTFTITNAFLTTDSEYFKTIGMRNNVMNKNETPERWSVSTYNITKDKSVTFNQKVTRWDLINGVEVINPNKSVISPTGIEGKGLYRLIIELEGNEEKEVWLEINTYKDVDYAKLVKVNEEEINFTCEKDTKIVCSGGFKFETSDQNYHIYFKGQEQNNGFTYKTSCSKEGDSETLELYGYKQIVSLDNLDADISNTRISAINRVIDKGKEIGISNSISHIEVQTSTIKIKQNNWWIGLIVGIVAGGVAIVVIIFLVRKVKKKYKVQNM